MDLFAISGYGQYSDLKRSRDVGYHQRLTKPVDLERLACLLEGCRGERETTSN